MHWRLRNRFFWYLGLLADLVIVPLVLLMPRNRKKIIFGAWGGNQYSCNPKYLMEYVVKKGGFDCVWIGKSHLKNAVMQVPHARFATKGSFLALWHCVTAGIWACNVQWRMDIAWIPRCRRANLLYLTHGSPDKKTGNLQLNGNGQSLHEADVKRQDGIRARVRCLIEKFWDFCYDESAWCSATSPIGEEIRLSNMPNRLSKSRMLHSGTPRFDYMIQNANNLGLRSEFRDKYSKLLGVPKGRKWILYVPTWRHDSNCVFSFQKSSMRDKYDEMLKQRNSIVIEKHHPITLDRANVNGGQQGSVYVVSRSQSLAVDMQELLLASDLLITDYSSIYYDFYLMNRPVIHYVYDYDHFMNVDMGFNFDIREYGGGPFAYTEDELMKFMGMSDSELLKLRNEKTKEHLTYETGHSCEAYYNLISRLSEENRYFV